MSKKVIKKRTKAKVEVVESQNDIKSLLITIGVIVAILAAFYLLTTIIKKDNVEEEQKEEQEPTISYTDIMFGNLFTYSGEYLVLASFEDDINLDLYNAYLSNYSSKEKALTYYIANMDNQFNKIYVDKENKLDTNNITELRINTTTLFRIKNKKVVSYYQGKDKIIAALEQLNK